MTDQPPSDADSSESPEEAELDETSLTAAPFVPEPIEPEPIEPEPIEPEPIEPEPIEPEPFEPEPFEPEPFEPEPFVPLAFVDVIVNLPSSYPTLVLEETDPPRRRMLIPIGMAEGVAIAYAARDILTPRPLTHELFTSALNSFGLSVETLRIISVTNNSFGAELVFSGTMGNRTLGCRVSDGVALCLRQRPPVPITVSPGVIDQVGMPNSSIS